VLRGDTDAFGMIIKSTEGLVAQIVCKMVSNAEDRKDLVQDVYLKVYKSLRNFKFEAKLSTWVGQIAYNTCLNHLQKKKPVLFTNLRRAHDADGEANEPLPPEANVGEGEVESSFFKQQLSEILQVEIDQLSPVYKTLITLYHQAELNYEEIAEITKLPEGTVKNYLFRARKALRDNLLRKYKKEEL
jgi:RNA polymerase sigma-70 factor (ECF subfamily)